MLQSCLLAVLPIAGCIGQESSPGEENRTTAGTSSTPEPYETEVPKLTEYNNKTSEFSSAYYVTIYNRTENEIRLNYSILEVDDGPRFTRDYLVESGSRILNEIATSGEFRLTLSINNSGEEHYDFEVNRDQLQDCNDYGLIVYIQPGPQLQFETTSGGKACGKLGAML
jgi:hypothetical protein